MEDFKNVNPYALLDLPLTADKSQIKKAYRTNSRKCHPDKNPDNPNAAALFHQLKKARDFLLDDNKRAEYDKKWKAQEANKVRDKEWDEQRQRFKRKLEEQERLAKEYSEAELNRKKEERLRREEVQRRREEDERYREKLEELRRENYCSKCRIKVTWNAGKDDPTKEYNEQNLRQMFSPYGEIEAIIISSKKKKKGVALIEYSTPEATKKAQLFVTGFPSNPLEVTILESNEDKARKQYESMIYTPKEKSSQTRPLFPSSSLIKTETTQSKEKSVPSKSDSFSYSTTIKSTSKSSKHSKSKSRRSDSDSSSEGEWVEKKVEKKPEKVSAPRRDDWMMDTSFVPTYSKHDKKHDEKEDEKKESILDKLGQSDRELNPYWKNGGTGLPEESRSRKTSDYDYYSKSKGTKSFLKPTDEDDSRRNYSVFDQPTSSKSRWRKQPTSPGTEKKVVRDKEDEVIEKRSEPQKSIELLSDQEMNALAAKILKAEIMGNQNLVKELKDKLENARKARQNQSETPDVVVLTSVNSRGFVQPLRNVSKDSHGDKRHKNYETHADGKRVRYFEDDQKYSLNEMFEREQMRTAADHNREFVELASKSKADKDYAIDDMFMEQSISNKSRKNNEMQHAIDKQKKTDKALDECYWCLTNNRIKKHLVISTSSKCYLCVPHFQSLTEGHCLIVPTYHATCATLLDEEVWQEVTDYCKTLVRMFRALDQDVVFFETAMHFKYYPHMVLHCVPIPYETGNLAPIYFKKAIQECEKEWSDNKKLVDYKKMNIRQAVPKGLPYFMVNFGMDNGFAHVIEEEKYFPKNFAQEIIGGILDLDHRVWRKQQTDDFETQCKKVNTFKEMWKTVDSPDS